MLTLSLVRLPLLVYWHELYRKLNTEAHMSHWEFVCDEYKWIPQLSRANMVLLPLPLPLITIAIATVLSSLSLLRTPLYTHSLTLT
jgi:hypothetical protein